MNSGDSKSLSCPTTRPAWVFANISGREICNGPCGSWQTWPVDRPTATRTSSRTTTAPCTTWPMTAIMASNCGATTGLSKTACFAPKTARAGTPPASKTGPRRILPVVRHPSKKRQLWHQTWRCCGIFFRVTKDPILSSSRPTPLPRGRNTCTLQRTAWTSVGGSAQIMWMSADLSSNRRGMLAFTTRWRTTMCGTPTTSTTVRWAITGPLQRRHMPFSRAPRTPWTNDGTPCGMQSPISSQNSLSATASKGTGLLGSRCSPRHPLRVGHMEMPHQWVSSRRIKCTSTSADGSNTNGVARTVAISASQIHTSRESTRMRACLRAIAPLSTRYGLQQGQATRSILLETAGCSPRRTLQESSA